MNNRERLLRQPRNRKSTTTNYHQSKAAAAATSFCNRLQMRKHYKAMLMRPASTLWDCHPCSVSVNLSSNVHQRMWRGMEETQGNNNQHLPPSCLHEAFDTQHRVLSSSFAWSLIQPHPHVVTKRSVNTDELKKEFVVFLLTKAQPYKVTARPLHWRFCFFFSNLILKIAIS